MDNTRDYPNFPGQLRVAPLAITSNLDLDRLLSTSWDTKLGFTLLI